MKKKAKTNLNTQGTEATGMESNRNNCDSDENEDDSHTKVNDDDDSINFGDNNYEDNASDGVSSSTDKSPGKGEDNAKNQQDIRCENVRDYEEFNCTDVNQCVNDLEQGTCEQANKKSQDFHRLLYSRTHPAVKDNKLSLVLSKMHNEGNKTPTSENTDDLFKFLKMSMEGIVMLNFVIKINKWNDGATDETDTSASNDAPTTTPPASNVVNTTKGKRGRKKGEKGVNSKSETTRFKHFCSTIRDLRETTTNKQKKESWYKKGLEFAHETLHTQGNRKVKHANVGKENNDDESSSLVFDAWEKGNVTKFAPV